MSIICFHVLREDASIVEVTDIYVSVYKEKIEYTVNAKEDVRGGRRFSYLCV